MSITQQIEDLIRRQAETGPGLVDGYESSLATAAGQDQQSIDSLGALYSDRSKFEKSRIGAFGLGLLAPNKSGLFSEDLYGGLAAATAAQDYNREANLTREEKLAKLSSLQATLTRQQGADGLDVYSKRNDLTTNLGQQNTQLADIELGKTPGDGAETPAENARRIYHDYSTNPAKYQGPQGQEIVKNAIGILNNERTNARYETVASQKAAVRPRLTSVDKTEIIKAKGGNTILQQTLNLLDEAEELGPKTLSGPMTGARAKVGAWTQDALGFGDTDGTSSAHLRYQQIMEGEAIKQMSETLKGATTDREMIKFIDIIADPSLPWDNNKKYALQQVREFAKAVMEDNSAKIKGIPDGSYYTGEEPAAEAPQDFGFDPAALPPEVSAWAQEQLDGGADPAQVLEYLRTEYGEQ